MSFTPGDDTHHCSCCTCEIELGAYRRFGLCDDCEVEREVERLEERERRRLAGESKL